MDLGVQLNAEKSDQEAVRIGVTETWRRSFENATNVFAVNAAVGVRGQVLNTDRF